MYGDGRTVHTRFFTIAKSLVFMPVRASQCAFHPRQLRPPSDARFVNSESGARVRGSIWLRAQGCFRRSFSQEVGQMNVAWNVETTMRFSAAVIGCAATPALVALASFRWKKDIGRELPRWRNGMGLAAIVIISALWLFQTTRCSEACFPASDYCRVGAGAGLLYGIHLHMTIGSRPPDSTHHGVLSAMAYSRQLSSDGGMIAHIHLQFHLE